jgi:RHS repeat-associated protein
MTDGGCIWNYAYDANGMRISRNAGSTTYTYVYNGTQLTWMTDGLDQLHFTYDAIGRPLTMEYHPVEHSGGSCGAFCGIYYYVTNLQGDVIAILDSSGNLEAEYTYDAWGNLIDNPDDTFSFIGYINPIRYRGYLYDRETGLYYLQSRYYNPEIGRFISADNYPSTGQGLTGNNMFAYCGNNPVSRNDEGGEFWHVVIGAVLGAAANFAISVVSDMISGEEQIDVENKHAGEETLVEKELEDCDVKENKSEDVVSVDEVEELSRNSSGTSVKADLENILSDTDVENTKYIICKSDTPKFNWWKFAAISLFFIIMMTVSYFVGYYKLLCPCTYEHIEEHIVDDNKQVLNEPVHSSDTITGNQNGVGDNGDESSSDEKEDLANFSGKTVSVEKNVVIEKKETVNKNSVNLKQVDGGKYKITGTKRAYRVDKGETIRTIAQQIYGSKGYAPYIIAHNNLKNPDNINAGVVIKLPELVRR